MPAARETSPRHPMASSGVESNTSPDWHGFADQMSYSSFLMPTRIARQLWQPHYSPRARTQVPHDCPIGIVIANREYEAWFLAAFATAKFRQALEEQGYRLRQRSLPRGMDVEAVADCKRRIETLVAFEQGGSTRPQPGRYRETIHQAALTRILPFTRGMARRSRSFRKLVKELDELLMKARRRR